MGALERSLSRETSLPLDNQPATGETQGLTRLKGAFLADVKLLQPDPSQPRKTFDEEELKGLAASIRRRGVRQPIRVRPAPTAGSYFIVSGECRFRAAVASGLSEIPCMIDGSDQTEREIRIDQVVENWQRADLRPVELHEALLELRDNHDMSQEEIAAETGKSKSEVSRFLSLGEVKAEILQEAKADASGTFTRTTLEALAKVPIEEQDRLAERVRTGSLSSKQVERGEAGEKTSVRKTQWP